MAAEDDAVAIVKRQIYRDWGLAAVVGRAICLTTVLTVALAGLTQPETSQSDDDLAEFAYRASLARNTPYLHASYDPSSRSFDVLHSAPRPAPFDMQP